MAQPVFHTLPTFLCLVDFRTSAIIGANSLIIQLADGLVPRLWGICVSMGTRLPTTPVHTDSSIARPLPARAIVRPHHII